MTKQKKIEKLARKIALQDLNDHRALAGLNPLPRLERLWWSLHKAEFIARAEKLEARYS